MEDAHLTAANLAAVRQWSNHPCGALSGQEANDLAYFEKLERDRYENYAPWMRQFFRFDGHHGQKVLEVGVGQGTDLVQFAKGGADVFGIDITQRHLDLATRNFELRGLHAGLQRATAAAIPFADNTFDLVYSFGVLHHTNDTVRCISECHRVLKPGGKVVLGLYHTFSLYHAYTIVVKGILRGHLRRLGYRGLMSRIESGADGVTIAPLVKTYSRNQLRHILEDFREVRLDVRHLAAGDSGRLRNFVPAAVIEFTARRIGWFLLARATK